MSSVLPVNSKPGFQSSRPAAPDAEFRTVWTADDEQRLQELRDRKQKVEQVGMDRIRSAMAALNLSGFQFAAPEFEDLCIYMMQNSSDIREALRTFDNRS